MIKTSLQLMNELGRKYKNPKTKIARMVRDRELFPVIRGLYETDEHPFSPALAGAIYGPSYVSFGFALGYYSLIPERVYTCRSATSGKNRRKYFSTPFGRFEYFDIPEKVFYLSVLPCKLYGREFLIASPEKAVCDQLYIYRDTLKDKDDLEEYLFDNMRYDEDEFNKLDKGTILHIAPLYEKKNLRLFAQYMYERVKDE